MIIRPPGMPTSHAPAPYSPQQFLAMLFGQGRGNALTQMSDRQVHNLASGNAPGGFGGIFAGMGPDFYRMLAAHLVQNGTAMGREGGTAHTYKFQGFPGLRNGQPNGGLASGRPPMAGVPFTDGAGPQGHMPPAHPHMGPPGPPALPGGPPRPPVLPIRRPPGPPTLPPPFRKALYARAMQR